MYIFNNNNNNNNNNDFNKILTFIEMIPIDHSY